MSYQCKDVLAMSISKVITCMVITGNVLHPGHLLGYGRRHNVHVKSAAPTTRADIHLELPLL
jgi:hypothetical protein